MGKWFSTLSLRDGFVWAGEELEGKTGWSLFADICDDDGRNYSFSVLTYFLSIPLLGHIFFSA